ncbi:unnamed protein product [Macrosiphum euphorbiae]|uniref:Uncharacterized protein n=1 Tax=Macrosiphum euphorbiae TaxID=13131 RepID=A0AAV0XR66_9HEMI|nr:unnamed protein product [Macrosiphum euphorbiae]
MKNVDTKFGTAVSCVLIDTEKTQTINVFLPKAIRMTDVDISEYVSLSVGDLTRHEAYPEQSMKNVNTQFGMAVSACYTKPRGHAL